MVVYRSFYVLLALIAVVFTLLLIFFEMDSNQTFSCHTPADHLNNVRFLITSFCEIMGRTGMRFWIDYGTLLGAVRHGDMLPWDHDGDISYDGRDYFNINLNVQHFYKRGIYINHVLMSYKSATVDLFRLSVENNTYRVEWRANAIEDHMRTKWDDILIDFVHPLGNISFAGVQCRAPSDPRALLRHRYPYANIDVPTPRRVACVWRYPLLTIRGWLLVLPNFFSDISIYAYVFGICLLVWIVCGKKRSISYRRRVPLII